MGLKPSPVEQAKFEYSPLGKIFNKGLDKDDKKEGLFKRLKNIENAQKGLINGNSKNKPDSAKSKWSISSVFDIISSESKDNENENEKTARELYQDRIEGMTGLKLPGEIESKNGKSQMYLENNLNKIKNNFSNNYDKYQRFFKYIANKEKDDINYEILSSKVDDINLCDRYNTLYYYSNYFSKLSTGKISIKNELFSKDLSKGFKLKSAYTKGKNNIEKAYDNLVFGDKNIDDVLYKKVNNELRDRNKNVFQ